MRMPRLKTFLVAALLFVPWSLQAYSVQTHEELIDLTWKHTIKPFLAHRFPQATDAELERAHAYAYGGCAIQDLGYYPFGHKFFSDLTHYVRSADFIHNLFREARSPNELAFAIGALSHYVGDTLGHSVAVNPAVAIEFPKLEKKYGSSVAYDEGPHAHIRTEFAFDIDQISQHRMAPSAYLRYVGLKVPTELLARAFHDTYGLNFEQVLGERRPVVRGYRFAVRSFIPRIAYAETVLHRSGFPPDPPSPPFVVFQQHLAAADFEPNWNKYRKKAGIGTYLLAGLIWIVPKVGPLSVLAIRGPAPETERRYFESVNASIDMLQQLLGNWDKTSSSLPNRDLDTGKLVRPGQYALTDKTYAKLLNALTHHPTQELPADLKENILRYYADPYAPITTKSHPMKWKHVQKDLVALNAMRTLPVNTAQDQPQTHPPAPK